MASLRIASRSVFAQCVYWNFTGRGFFAQFHQRGIHGNACQPSGESRPSVKTLQVKECVKEAFLNRILRVLAISCNATSNAEHFLGMTLIQIIEGTAVTHLRDRRRARIDFGDLERERLHVNACCLARSRLSRISAQAEQASILLFVSSRHRALSSIRVARSHPHLQPLA